MSLTTCNATQTPAGENILSTYTWGDNIEIKNWTLLKTKEKKKDKRAGKVAVHKEERT